MKPTDEEIVKVIIEDSKQYIKIANDKRKQYGNGYLLLSFESAEKLSQFLENVGNVEFTMEVSWVKTDASTNEIAGYPVSSHCIEMFNQEDTCIVVVVTKTGIYNFVLPIPMGLVKK
jgi:predicted HAD superfamily hydrolase